MGEKMKMFIHADERALEEKVNYWLVKNKRIKILSRHVAQSIMQAHPHNRFYTIVIFYRPASKKRAAKK